MKRILVVSHCILNTAAKVAQDETALAAEYALRNQLLQLVLAQNVQLLQLPCPEFQLYGSKRWGHTKDQFLHPHYRAACTQMLEPIVCQLEEYLSSPADFDVLGIVSVEGSPSCGWGLTCRGAWGGELAGGKKPLPPVTMAHASGAMMDILAQLLAHRQLSLPIMSMHDALALLTQK